MHAQRCTVALSHPLITPETLRTNTADRPRTLGGEVCTRPVTPSLPFARCKSRPSSRGVCPSCGVISRCADVNFECTQVRCLVLFACMPAYGDRDCHEHANVARGHARTGFAVSYIVHKNLHDRYHLPASKEGHLHPKLNDAATHNTNMIRTDRSPEYRCDVMIQHHRRDS